MIKNFLNPEGHTNPITAILLEGWILPIDVASLVEGLRLQPAQQACFIQKLIKMHERKEFDISAKFSHWLCNQCINICPEKCYLGFPVSSSTSTLAELKYKLKPVQVLFGQNYIHYMSLCVLKHLSGEIQKTISNLMTKKAWPDLYAVTWSSMSGTNTSDLIANS